MKKIPTVFERDWDGDRSRVLDQVHPGCEWVLAGEGVATRKYDGTCVMFDGTAWWARREVRAGKPEPLNFRAEQEDETTGKVVGWEPIDQSSFARFFGEAVESGPPQGDGEIWPPGTYELVGPKVQGNPERAGAHGLIRHGGADVFDVPDRSFEGIREVLERIDAEGLVFHHPDGRMAKVKKRDFGIKR